MDPYSRSKCHHLPSQRVGVRVEALACIVTDSFGNASSASSCRLDDLSNPTIHRLCDSLVGMTEQATRVRQIRISLAALGRISRNWKSLICSASILSWFSSACSVADFLAPSNRRRSIDAVTFPPSSVVNTYGLRTPRSLRCCSRRSKSRPSSFIWPLVSN